MPMLKASSFSDISLLLPSPLLPKTDGTKPVLFDTDVNAPALAEFTYHASSPSQSSVAYITVGTGVGVGLVINGKTVHGLVHPEGGHVPPFRLQSDGLKGTFFVCFPSRFLPPSLDTSWLLSGIDPHKEEDWSQET